MPRLRLSKKASVDKESKKLRSIATKSRLGGNKSIKAQGTGQEKSKK